MSLRTFLEKNKSKGTVPADFPVRVAAAILAVIWMFRIFSFSSDTAETSGTVSRSMSYNMIEKISGHLGLDWDEEKIESLAGPVEKYLRKAAHMGEYAVLSFLWSLTFAQLPDLTLRDPDKRRIAICSLMIPFCICLIYAVTDEFHQTFVDGRSGEVRDVLLDLSGAVLGILALRLLVLLFNRLISHRIKGR